MGKYLFIFLSLLLSFVGSTQHNCKNCGVAYLVQRWYDLKRKVIIPSKYERDYRFLFFDSMIIAERHALYPDPDPKRVRVEINGYTFIDFRTESFYNYHHLSDTASIILAVRQPTKGRVKGGWNFFDPPWHADSSLAISDTIIIGNSYHRKKGFYIKNGKVVAQETHYYVSEVERPLAFYGKIMAGDQRNSLTRIDWSTTTDILHYTSVELASTNLTKKELKIFAAWKKNADKHPVPTDKEDGLYVLGPQGSLVLDKEATEKFARQKKEVTKKFTQ